jgi:hypothetical protein
VGMTDQLAIIPAVLVSLACLLILYGQEEVIGKQRLLWFLTAMSVVALSVALITNTFFSRPYHPISDLATLLPATIWGSLTLVILNRQWLPTMRSKQRQITLGGLLLTLVLMGLLWGYMLAFIFMIGPGIAILLLAWSAGRRYPRLIVALSAITLIYFLTSFQAIYGPWRWPDFRMPLLFGLLPVLMVVLAALLITMLAAPEAKNTGRWRSAHWTIGALALSLLGSLTYTIYWMSVWDQTSDGLAGVITAVPAGFVAIIAGMVMVVAGAGKVRPAGLLFTILAPTLFFQAFHAGWATSYHAITEERAARMATALDQFHRREGHYPQTLADLTPRDLLYVQRPIILRTENWCYEGSDDYYRLATFYREFFSGPVSLRVYASGGEPPSGEWLCEARLAEVKERYRSFADNPAALRPPVPTPLPPIDVGLPKTPVQPVLDGVPVAAGSWSPDSRYFVFGALNGTMRLHFLNGRTGEICAADGQFGYVGRLHQQHAWLPDGRLLYLDPGGEMVVLTPCQPGAERLTGQLPAPFNQIAAYEQTSGQLLLLDKRMEAGSFWIMDGRTYTLTPIPGVTPNAYDLHWDNATWLSGGQQLVSSRLDGRRGSNAGATLFLINGDSGQIELSHHLPGDFGQSAPPVEGLSPWEVVLHGQGELFLVDFRAEPPAFVNVFADIFQLDISFPHDVSAYGTYVDEPENGYYLATRLNHPRSQATYLYHSATGQIHRYEHENHTLLLFPNGRLVEMANWANVPAYQDSYDPVLVADPDREQATLSLTGHTPREHPHLSLRYLSQTSQIAVGSAHGVSLVSWPEGEMITYWDLAGPGFSPWLISSPDGTAFVAVKEGGGLYGPLPGRQE